MRLVRLSRSTFALSLAVTASACSLPRVRPVIAPRMVDGDRPRTVALLPPDLGVTVRRRDGRLHHDQVLNRALIQRVRTALVASLGRRGYRVTRVLAVDGSAMGQGRREQLLHPVDLHALRAEIDQVTAGLRQGPGLVRVGVSSELTRYLQAQTGCDASLYARGWIYVAPGDSAAVKAARVIGVTLVVIALVGIVIVLAAGKGGGGGIGNALGGALRATGQAAVKAAAVAGRVAIRALPHVIEAAARTGPVVCQRCDGPQAPAPVLSVARSGGRELSRSTVGIGISLVDNASGAILWHAGQRFEIESRGEGRVERIVDHFLRQLPAAQR